MSENAAIEAVEIIAEKSFFKKFLMIFTGKFSPFKIVFYYIIYKMIIKGIFLNLFFEGARGVHVITNRETLKEVRQHTTRAIIYTIILTTILICVLEYNYNFIINSIDELKTFFTSIIELFKT